MRLDELIEAPDPTPGEKLVEEVGPCPDTSRDLDIQRWLEEVVTRLNELDPVERERARVPITEAVLEVNRIKELDWVRSSRDPMICMTAVTVGDDPDINAPRDVLLWRRRHSE